MASQEETAMMRTQYPDSDCLFLQGCGNLHKDTPLAAASRWTGGDPAISVEFKSDMFWKHITACKLRDRFDTGELHKVQQSKLTLLWQQLVSFIQIQCNWLHPGGTPGSNILIKLICEILTMWVFRWLVIWCERSLCFHWRDTRGAGTCFGKTLQKIIAVELSWVQAITNDSVCLSPRETRFLHHRFFFSSCFWWWPVKVFFSPSSSFVSNLLWMIHNSHQLDYDVSEERKKVCTALAFVQMFFCSCALGKHMYINSVFSKSPQHWYLFWNMLPFSSISCWPSMKVFALLNKSAFGKWTLTSLEQRKVSIPTFRPLFFVRGLKYLLLCFQVFTLIVHVSCFCKQQICWNLCVGLVKVEKLLG